MKKLSQSIIVEGSKLRFPDSYKYELYEGKIPSLTKIKNILPILQALSRFLNGETKTSNEVEIFITAWEDHFKFYRIYIMQGEVGIKFYPGNTLELIFPDGDRAIAFYKYFKSARHNAVLSAYAK